MNEMLAHAVCEDACPVKRAAQVIEGKWTPLLIRELLSGKDRYAEIHRALHGISPEVLTARLRYLEADGLLSRTVCPTVSTGTAYELTALGQKLEPLLLAMAQFGIEIERAENRADADDLSTGVAVYSCKEGL